MLRKELELFIERCDTRRMWLLQFVCALVEIHLLGVDVVRVVKSPISFMLYDILKVFVRTGWVHSWLISMKQVHFML